MRDVDQEIESGIRKKSVLGGVSFHHPRSILGEEAARNERKRKFQENVQKMKSSPSHPNAGKEIDMIPYLKEHPEATKEFLKEAELEHWKRK
jgi:hypothetical protein